MSKYEYTDTNDSLIKIGPTISNDQVFIQIRDVEVSIAGYVRNEDAPAIALAILEAAGHGAASYCFEGHAVDNLRAAIRERAKEAEREAEEAKVAAYRLHQFKAQNRNPNPELEADTWKDMGEASKDLWRNEYRAARKFFEEA